MVATENITEVISCYSGLLWQDTWLTQRKPAYNLWIRCCSGCHSGKLVVCSLFFCEVTKNQNITAGKEDGNSKQSNGELVDEPCNTCLIDNSNDVSSSEGGWNIFSLTHVNAHNRVFVWLWWLELKSIHLLVWSMLFFGGYQCLKISYNFSFWLLSLAHSYFLSVIFLSSS